jgi:hypothetical protein
MRYLRKAAIPRGFAGSSQFERWRPDWLAGVGGLELGNVAAGYRVSSQLPSA